jgi:hypothetical protein
MFAAADIMQKRHFFAIAAWSLQLVFQIEKQPFLTFLSHFSDN